MTSDGDLTETVGSVVTDPVLGAGVVMERLAGQSRVLAERPRRLDLLRWRATWPLRPICIRVHRNQPFEFVASVLGPFLAFADLEPSFAFGPYDDALSGVGETPRSPADVELIWLDFASYLRHQEPEAIATWLASRVRALRLASPAPILVAGPTVRGETASLLNALLGADLAQIAGCNLVDQAAVANDLGEMYADARLERFAGSALSDAAAIETARRFGLAWIPAVLQPRLKAVVLDLDNTLYDGVLGEDGPMALSLSDERADLQRRLVELADSGILLAILRPELLSAIAANWRPKAEGMVAIAERLRIGPESILFVDDNPGELAAVADDLPGVVPLHAADAGQALRGLRWYPGLAALRPTREDTLRAADLASIEARQTLQATASDPPTYLRSLGVRLLFARSPADQVARIHELSTKTNQFNTGFLRLSEPDAAVRLSDPAAVVVTVSLQDRLSDSGVVGLVVVRTTPGAQPVVDEVAISCRALGRGVEDAIVAEALRGAVGSPPPDRISFAFRDGPRNGPAREWLGRISGAPVEAPGVEVRWFRIEEARQAVAPLVELVWREAQ